MKKKLKLQRCDVISRSASGHSVIRRVASILAFMAVWQVIRCQLSDPWTSLAICGNRYMVLLCSSKFGDDNVESILIETMQVKMKKEMRG